MHVNSHIFMLLRHSKSRRLPVRSAARRSWRNGQQESLSDESMVEKMWIFNLDGPEISYIHSIYVIIHNKYNIYICIPRTQMTPIFEGQRQKKAFSNQNRGHLGSRIYIIIYNKYILYIYIHIYMCVYHMCIYTVQLYDVIINDNNLTKA